jgi:FkbH-like protein
MRLQLDDFAVFHATWDSKADGLVHIANELDLGLDSFVYLDDNPVERQEIRRFLPDVDVVALPEDPALYARTLASYPYFESAAFTDEDAKRADQYRARAEVRSLERSAASIDDFYRDLAMRATVAPFTEGDLPRLAQLVGKTNQFNLTTRRHDLAALQAMAADPDCVHLAVRLADRFADHGLVAVFVGRRDGDALDIDTWLMSCRVIGRTLEQTVLAEAADVARRLGCTELRGTYVPTAKNGLVRDLYPRLGFESVAADGETTDTTEATQWRLAIAGSGPEPSPFIETHTEV